MKRILALLALAILTLASASAVSAADRTQDSIVSGANGGGLNSDNGQLQWYVPGGAYGQDLKIKYTPKTRAHFPGEAWTYSTFILAIDPFTLDVEILDGGEGIDTEKPMTLTIHYNPIDLGGRSESAMRVARFDGGRSEWFPLDTSVVDPVRHIVTAQTTEAGDYAIIAYNEAPPADSTAASQTESTPAPAPAPEPAIPMNSSIGGKVFYDRDGNGTMDGDDFAIAGAGLKISSGTWSAFTTSGADGSYAFPSLRESAYNLELVVGPEWAQTTPASVADIRVDGLGSTGSANFGMWYKLP